MKIIETELKLTPEEIYLVARALDDSMKRFYAIPENEAKFQEWLKKRKARAAGGEEQQNSGETRKI